MSNRLARERSPYLLQHADNPVDWLPWGEEAFARARAEDKPIFLSIGYSTCHWCHVMAHESFEDPAVAAVLNAGFVPIKLDREERPDIDRVYMTFVQATTGAGGWPMSVWLTPDLKPFFGGTYFPPSNRWGRPGFVDVLHQLASAWRDQRGDVTRSADDMLEKLREATVSGTSAPDRAPVAGREAVVAGIASFAQGFDPRHGGFGGAPKFPRPSELVFMLHGHALTRDWPARQMALDTLRHMALGGIRDHVGGGFHRYSVDGEWRVPHFEKMLYDQAQLVIAYLEGAQVSGDPFYAAVAEDTLAYVARDLTAPGGAFFSAEDADSPVVSDVPAVEAGHGAKHHDTREGAFYVWTEGELRRLLGDDEEVFSRRFGVEPHGNALADPQGEFVDQNILYIAQPIEDVAVRAGVPVEQVMAALIRSRERLFAARAQRPRPHLDDKVLTAWNGLMIAAFARAARALVDSPRRGEWRDAAVRAAEWIRANLWHAKERRLLRRYRDGEAAVDGFCEDYAYLVWGLVELFQATVDGRWLDWALELTSVQASLFSDERDGGWFSTTGQDASVLLRLKEDYDGAEPAAMSVTVRNLLVLGHLAGDAALVNRASRTLERYGPEIGRIVRVMPLMVANVALWHLGASQVVIASGADGEETARLERVLASRYLPGAVALVLPPSGADAALAARAPWLAAMAPRNGKATAFVCRDFACREPVTGESAFQTQLDDLAPARILGPS